MQSAQQWHSLQRDRGLLSFSSLVGNDDFDLILKKIKHYL